MNEIITEAHTEGAPLILVKVVTARDLMFSKRLIIYK